MQADLSLCPITGLGFLRQSGKGRQTGLLSFGVEEEDKMLQKVTASFLGSDDACETN